jgi:hypothetical protein
MSPHIKTLDAVMEIGHLTGGTGRRRGPETLDVYGRTN